MIEIEIVEIPSVTFKVGKYPVTQEQYREVMGNNPSHFQGKPKNPVEQVGYGDAIVFCQKLSEITGKNYRLPTESEWEYACRAGTTTDYCFGNYFDDNCNYLKDYAWYSGNSQGTTHPVGLKLPNAWGLYDMHGNVWEWCQEGCNMGGSWYELPYYCCSASSKYLDWRDDFSNDSGFRVVCD